MLISTNFLKQSLENYKKAKKQENFTPRLDSVEMGALASFETFILIVSIIFFVLEFLLLYYAISFALRCSKTRPERITHLVLATIFTLPYALLSVFFGKCAQNVLGDDSIFLTNQSKYNFNSLY